MLMLCGTPWSKKNLIDLEDIPEICDAVHK